MLVAAAIRILTIDNQSFWADEALTAYEAQLPFGAMLNTVKHVETTPPLYFVLVWVWAHVFGTGEVALRSLSTIAGIALVPIAYLAARELVSRRAGVLAAAFVDRQPVPDLVLAGGAGVHAAGGVVRASFLWFMRARSEPSRRNLSWWAVCSALALMTHFFAGFLVAPEAMWLLWVARSRVAAVAVAAVARRAAGDAAVRRDRHHARRPVDRARYRGHRVPQAILEWAVRRCYRRATIAEALLAAARRCSRSSRCLAIWAAIGGPPGRRRSRRRSPASCCSSPLAARLVGQDYFLSRNEIPAFVPLATVVAAACAAPRTRVVGGRWRSRCWRCSPPPRSTSRRIRYLQRPELARTWRMRWARPVPRAIIGAGRARRRIRSRSICPNVGWVRARSRRVMIGEVDVVGAQEVRAARGGAHARPRRMRLPVAARPAGLPRSVAPRGHAAGGTRSGSTTG